MRIVLVTGRRYPAAKKIADDLGGDPALILHNGGLIVEAGTPVRVRPLNRDTAIKVVRFSKRRRADPVVHFGHRGEGLLYVENALPSHTLLAYYLSRSHPDVRIVEDLETAIMREAEDPLQVMFGGGMEEMLKLAQAIEVQSFDASALRTVYPRDDLSLIDVVGRAVDKSEALRFLCDRWGVDVSEILAVGDNWNDREMLRMAGIGCVMGNAEPDLKCLGLTLVQDNDRDGVAEAIQRFILDPVAEK